MACENFSDFVLGKEIAIETDHKPLVPLLWKTSLNRLPPRVLRFRLWLSHFSYSISHVPGKSLYTADTLSRAPTGEAISTREELDTEHFVRAIVSGLPVSKDQLDKYREAQQADTS